ncbi:MAG TPA: hypothetical protein PK766_12825 [Bacteroidales bacterium]|nr:hypothetical protein [Bacteroidales bacterium]
MKNRIILSVILLFAGITFIMPQSYILPDFASKYNNTALGKNVFVFDPSMDMNEGH